MSLSYVLKCYQNFIIHILLYGENKHVDYNSKLFIMKDIYIFFLHLCHIVYFEIKMCYI